MDDENKTKEQVMSELAKMRQRIAELEISEAKRRRVEKHYVEIAALLGDTSGKRQG